MIIDLESILGDGKESLCACYCGACFRAAVSLPSGAERLISAKPCPTCGQSDFLSTVRGELERAIVSSEFKRRDEEKKTAAEVAKASHDIWWAGHLDRMGMSPNWKPSFNVQKNGVFVLEELPYIGKHDFSWLCNQIAKMVQDINDGCIDNFRLCAGPGTTSRYEEAHLGGCCGSYDTMLYNPKTGNTFWLGCNYGH